MKEGWIYKKLGEVGSTQTGTTPSKSNPANYGNYIPFIRPAEIPLDGSGRINYNSEIQLSEEGLRNGRLFKKGSILMVCIGTIGKLGFVERDISCNQQINVLTPKTDYCSKYIFYAMSSPAFQNESLKIAQGAQATIPIINKGKWSNIEIPIPKSLDEQRAIVARLDSAFANIDALKANATRQLSEARKLFQKALEEAMTPKEGWEEKTLKEVSQIAGDYGLNVSSKPFDGIRYLRITDITDWGDLNDDKVSAKVDSDKKQEELEEGDILFARTGATVGKTLVYRKEFGECLYAGYLIRYRLKKECVLPRYMHYITHSKEYYDWVSTNQEAAAQPNISARKYNLLPIHYPSLQTQRSIVTRLDSLSANIRALEEVLQKIIAECDALKQAMLRQVFE